MLSKYKSSVLNFFTSFLSEKRKRKSHKDPIKDGWLEPLQGKEKGKAKERPKDARDPKKGERASNLTKSSCGSNPR
jgi:hypothetical protein